MPNIIFEGYAEVDGGVKQINIVKNDFNQFIVYDYNGEHDDFRYTPKEFVTRYGLKLYSTLEDFKRGNSIDAYKVLV